MISANFATTRTTSATPSIGKFTPLHAGFAPVAPLYEEHSAETVMSYELVPAQATGRVRERAKGGGGARSSRTPSCNFSANPPNTPQEFQHQARIHYSQYNNILNSA